MATFSELIERAQKHDEFWEDDIAGDFTEELVRWMEEKGISRTELASRIGHRPSYITKVLRGTANLTGKSMAKLARAIGARVRIHLAPLQSRTVWYDVYNTEPSTEQIVNASVSGAEEMVRRVSSVDATTATARVG
jgi:plasmid maintenance system antidote protein VapI